LRKQKRAVVHGMEQTRTLQGRGIAADPLYNLSSS
jgi:hypothetical protein